jgi:hypothetical protein
MPSVAVESLEEPERGDAAERDERSSGAAADDGGSHASPDVNEDAWDVGPGDGPPAAGAAPEPDTDAGLSLPPALTTPAPEPVENTPARSVAERSPDSANVHTRRTMPPPSLLDDAPPSVAARRFPSKQKTLQFAPISPLDAPSPSFEQTPTPSASLLDAHTVAANDDAPLVAELFTRKRSTPPEAAPAAAPEPAHEAASTTASKAASTQSAALPGKRSDARGAASSAPAAVRSRNRAVAAATPPARAAVLATLDRAHKPAPGPAPDSPDVVEAALEPHLAWLSEHQRPRFYERLLCGEYGELLRMMRAERERQPRLVSIAKAMSIVEQAECSRLLHELGATSSEVIVVDPPHTSDDSPRSTLLRLARTTATLAELLASSPLSKLRTLQILHDLRDEGALVLRSPARDRHVTGFGRGMLSENVRGAIEDRAGSHDAADDRTSAEASFEELEHDWADGLGLLARARLDAAERSTDEHAEVQDRPTVPFVEALLPRSLTDKLASTDRTPAVLGAIELTRREDDDSLPPPPSTPANPASLRPSRVESVAQVEPAHSVAPPASRVDAPAPAPRSMAPSARAQWLTLPLALAALVVSTVTLTVMVMRPSTQPAATPVDPKPQVVIAQAAPTPAPVPSPSPSPDPKPAAGLPATVRLEVEVHPPYARVFLDGSLVGHPVRTSLPRDGALHELRFEAGGHKPQQRSFQADRDSTFVIHLEPMPKLSPAPAQAPRPEPIYE